ncbi:MAG TPA: class F sortase [Jatrophihabitans sp.]|nr:class F sortase [Jatrophihabitans sp.]
MRKQSSLNRTLLESIGWVPIACALGAVMALSLAGITWITSPYWGHSTQATVSNKGVVPTIQGAPVALAAVLPPNRIEIPKIKAVAPIVPVQTTPNGELDVPVNPKIVGWWSPGAKPGARVGTAIFAGHINYAGVTGPLARIGTLNPGDKVYVYGKEGAAKTRLTFSITGVRTYHKTRLPYKEIFNQHSVGRLAIVTCGGPFDAATGNYLDNIVAFAVPAVAPKPTSSAQ